MHEEVVLGAQSVAAYLALAISLTVVKSVATGLLKLRCLYSRWSYITYASYASVVVSAAVALSPALLSYAAPTAGFASPEDFLQRTNILQDGRLLFLYAGRPEIACVQFIVQLAAVYQLHAEGLLTVPACPAFSPLAYLIHVLVHLRNRPNGVVTVRTHLFYHRLFRYQYP